MLNKDNLIEQVMWLLERLSVRQILRVLALANRLFVTDLNTDLKSDV